MVKNTPTKASWEQHLTIAKLLHGKGLKADQAVEWFKSRKYTLKGLRYEATRVSAMIAGMEISTTKSIIDVVNTRLKDGTLKYTKAKLVHTPKA